MPQGGLLPQAARAALFSKRNRKSLVSLQLKMVFRAPIPFVRRCEGTDNLFQPKGIDK
jgi:hypothetical protein